MTVTSPPPVAEDTRHAAYADRLRTKSGARWKEALDVQRPYRWNVRRQELGRTLDVGCGIGRNLAALPPGSLGVDHNETSVRMARSRGLQAMTVEEWARSPERVEGAFDSLLVAHVIEHLLPGGAPELLQGYLRYVRPGGKVLLICPQERGYATDATHLTFTTGRDLEALARRVGLEPEPWFSFPLPRLAGRVFAYNEFCLLARKPV